MASIILMNTAAIAIGLVSEAAVITVVIIGDNKKT